MKERGFTPFTAAGALIVLLVLGVVGQATWSRHQRSLSTIKDISASEITAIAAGVQSDLQSALKYSVYRALWEVGKRASDYNDAEREIAIESLARRYFTNRLWELRSAYARHDDRVELNVPVLNIGSWVNLEEIDGGYVLVRVGFQAGSELRLKSRDGSVFVALPLKTIEVLVDSRYFLLQERMREFTERRGDICASWQVMEYIAAWGEAWLTGNINLSDSLTKTFFEIAWALHEYNIFGSSDYWGAAKGLIDAVGAEEGDNLLDELTNRTVVVTPIKAADVEKMCGYINSALDSIQSVVARLGKAKRCVGLARDKTAQLSDNIENLDGALKNIRKLLDDAVGKIGEARGEISDVSAQFNKLLEFVGSSSNSLIATLYQSLTTRALTAEYPSLKEQVEWAVGGTLAKLSQLEQTITSASAELDGGVEGQLNGLFKQATASVNCLLSEPVPLRWVTFTTYEDNPPRPVETKAPVYIDGEMDGTVGVLKTVLEGVRSSFDKMEELSQRYGSMPDELQKFEIDEELMSRLKGGVPKFAIDREDFYEILPPAPINPSPGLSVFHDFNIKEISNQRVDLAGKCGLQSATPIPLWFIGITLWWGQWETTIQLEPRATEKIFDFNNPVLPQPHGTDYVHKPLAYTWEMPEETWGINVIVVSLMPFSISSS